MKAKRHITCVLAFLTAVMSGTLSCDSNDDDLKVDISFDKNLISLVVGDSETISATLTPSGVPASGLEWISGNEDVLTVSDGVITSLSPGRTTVHARIGMNSAYCDVIVTAVPVDVTSVAVNKTELSIPVGHVETLRAVIEPEEATDKKVEWSTSDPSIVSVTEDGQIKANSLGEAVVTVTTRNGGHTAHCAVSVIPSITLVSPGHEERIKLDGGSRDAYLGFGWECDVAEVNDFIIMVNPTNDFTAPAWSQNLSSTTVTIPQYVINDIAKDQPGDEVTLYWIVKPQTNPEAAFTSASRLSVVPDRNEYLKLDQPTASGITLTKLDAPNDYRITGTGTATVRTVDLTREVGIENMVVSFRYTSNRELNGFRVNLIRGGTTVKSVQKDLPQSDVMTSHRMVLDELPDGWGQTSDCLEFDFGNATGLDMDIDAIHFAKLNNDEHLPLVFEIVGSQHLTFLSGGVGSTEASLRTTSNDPGVRMRPPTCQLLPSAVILSFEYKTAMPMQDRMRVFIYGEHIAIEQITGKYVGITENLPQPVSDWTEYTIDLSYERSFTGWGDTYGNWEIRFDPGNREGYEIEIRNFRMILKE